MMCRMFCGVFFLICAKFTAKYKCTCFLATSADLDIPQHDACLSNPELTGTRWHQPAPLIARPFQWLLHPSNPEDARNLVGDVICFFLLTALAVIAAYLCLMGRCGRLFMWPLAATTSV